MWKYLRIMKILISFLVFTLSQMGVSGVVQADSSQQKAQLRSQQTISSSTKPKALDGVGITEKLNQQVDLQGLSFKDETGQTVKLSQYFNAKKPVVLNLLYFECPRLCSLVLNGFLETLKKTDWKIGETFEILSVSIDPKEGPELAAEKKKNYLAALGDGQPKASAGWHFLTGEENQLKSLANQVGFGYRYDEQEQQYAHSAVLIVLSPEGKVSRYLYGVDFPVPKLKLALNEASEGKAGTFIDRILLFCYRYDPVTRTYSILFTRVLQIAAGLTVLLMLLVYRFVLRSKEHV